MRVPLLCLSVLLLLLPSSVTGPASPALFAQVSFAAEPLDINTATLDQLRALPGMGNAYAARIVRGRPYTAKNQLSQRGILPDAAYVKIKDLIIAKRAKK